MGLTIVLATLIPQEDIIPAWEDAANKNGGKWSVQLPKEKTKATIDQMWLYTVSHRRLPINAKIQEG